LHRRVAEQQTLDPLGAEVDVCLGLLALASDHHDGAQAEAVVDDAVARVEADDGLVGGSTTRWLVAAGDAAAGRRAGAGPTSDRRLVPPPVEQLGRDLLQETRRR